MEMFCKDLRDQTMKIINYENKEMIPLTMKKKSFMKNKEFAIYVEKNLVMIKNTVKLEIMTIIQENLGELPIIFVI